MGKQKRHIRRSKKGKRFLAGRRTIYYIYNRELVYKKGLNKGFLRSVSTKRDANVFISNNPDAYIVKKIRV